ncbi:hypothetical protein HMPREF3218_0200938 [Prevotella bivia]|nr:hypothetical protein HMPREF3218_0200938 [Prevotella bivia]
MGSRLREKAIQYNKVVTKRAIISFSNHFFSMFLFLILLIGF